MRRTAVACVLVLALAAPVSAQQQDARILKGVEQRAPDHIEHRADGLSILSYNLPDNDRQVRLYRKNVFPYIVYTSIGEPGLSSGIDAFDLRPLESTRYYYAMVVANFGTGSASGTLTLKLTGPTRWTRTFPNTTVSGRTFTVLYYQGQPLNRTGNYLLKGTFKGAGSMKSRFCAGC